MRVRDSLRLSLKLSENISLAHCYSGISYTLKAWEPVHNFKISLIEVLAVAVGTQYANNITGVLQSVKCAKISTRPLQGQQGPRAAGQCRRATVLV